MMQPKYRRYSLLAIRLILGLLFVVSGIGKLINGSDAQYLVELLATKFYWLIEYSSLIVTVASITELILAALLLSGRFLRSALSGTLLMLISFTSVLSYFYVQGMSVKSCGCFGAFGFASGLEFTLVRNSVLIILSILGLILATRKNSVSDSNPEPVA